MFGMIASGILAIVGVGFCAITSPVAVLHLLFILGKVPYHALRVVIGFVLPSLLEKDVSSEIVVVTGGAGGIGKLMAQKMAQLGAQVVLLDKNEEALDVARREVNTFARKEKPVQAFAVDISDRNAAYAAMESEGRRGECHGVD
jgi:NADPH:quinone reductase-like Zn-dependent oxidoreductase